MPARTKEKNKGMATKRAYDWPFFNEPGVYAVQQALLCAVIQLMFYLMCAIFYWF